MLYISHPYLDAPIPDQVLMHLAPEVFFPGHD
jgi:hypothetical protein